MSEASRTYWDGQAASFDSEPDHGLLDPAIRDAWRSVLIEQLPPAPADIVDLGCGTGTLTLLLAECGYRVRGLDFSEAMIAAASSKAARASLPVTFTQGDASMPPYQRASCDVVLSRHLLWALPDPSTALANWCHLLRPNGRLLLIEGRWSTGTGIAAADCERLIRAHRTSVTVHQLNHPALWGHQIHDERYLAVSKQ